MSNPGIVSRGTGFETLQVSKGHDKGVAIESTTTVHNQLFYVRAIWRNDLTVTFLLVSCSCKIENLLLFMHGQGKNGNKN